MGVRTHRASSKEEHAMPIIIWTVKARQQIRCALAGKLCEQSICSEPRDNVPTRGADVLQAEMDRINELLQRAFPKAASLVVQERFQGFRPREGQHIVLVEVDHGDESGPFVVKIGPVETLEKEKHAWDCCRPVGLRNDLVFLPLMEGTREPKDQHAPDKEWMCLVYGDAQQFIGVDTTTTLEEAALKSVRFGVPLVESICVVIVELFERIGHLFYRQSFEDDPGKQGYVFDLPKLHKLDKNLELWRTSTSHRVIRRTVDAVVNRERNELLDAGATQKQNRLLDPAHYLEYVLKHITWKDNEGQEHLPTTQYPSDYQGMRPGITDLIPHMMRGCAHGDLHGRNILVGIVRERALWPTVFDYEDMGPCNRVGWDFVKLETELKIRAYPELFPSQSTTPISSILKFETELAELTQGCHGGAPWPPISDDGKENRLRSILLQIRQMAAIELEQNRDRRERWLEEYNFLLACYGISTARFGNLGAQERLGAYISAGVAVARLSWPRSI
jgi:hypothetical protein